MPYIDKSVREMLISQTSVPKTPGELNFLLTSIIDDYMTLNGRSYRTINDIVGALEGAKMEFYRRVAVPYEERKRMENGDVYSEEFTD